MIAKILFLTVLVVVFIQLWLLAARRVSSARVQIAKVEKPFLPDDKLAQYAQELASSFSVGKLNCYNGLKAQLASYFAYITSVYRQLNVKSVGGEALPSAAEWILDNYYIVEKEIAKIEDSLSQEMLEQAPAVTEGEYKSKTVAYALAKEFVAHRISQVDEASIRDFLGEYTHHAHLNSDEIWLFFDMVKLALIENIAYLCKRIRFCIKEYEYAHKYAAYVLSKQADAEQMRQKVLRYFTRGRIDKTFVSAFLGQVKHEGQAGARITTIVDEALHRRGLDSRQVVLDEQAMQARYQTSMGGCIRAIVAMESMDLAKLFDEVSGTVRLLKADPAGIYEQMDTESKQLYLEELRSLADRAGVTEDMAAEEAVKLAESGSEEPARHIGYYLLGAGRAALLRRLGCNRPEWSGGKWLYFCSIWIPSLLAGVLAGLLLLPVGVGAAIFFGVLFFLLATQPAAELANSIAAKLAAPKPLPKLVLREGIPKQYSTLIVTTTLLFDKAGIDTLVENLEDFYLLNREENLYFALLADYKDSDENTVDSELEIYARQAVERLNFQYAKENKKFYFLLRSRTFCESEGRWMGAERKRGALCELVRLLKTGAVGSFTSPDATLPALGIKYVITLDADTRLQHGTAARMVGAMAHPVNRPVIDPEKNIVINGYAIMQPKVGIDIESAGKTFYTKVYAAYGGLDAYSGASSDVYQDLFGEAIFVGKGIFDVDAFYQVLHERLPKERILSHDLLEGSYLRCALLSDTEVSDSYPPKYLSHISRLHRWTRGDWQLLPWLCARVPSPKGKTNNPLNALSRYKIFDNLRRSVIPIVKLLLLVAALFLPASYAYATVGVTLLLGAYPLLHELWGALTGRMRYRVSAKFNARILYGAKRAVYEYLLGVTMLVYEAYQMADAAIRTLWRLAISKKHMLSWVTAQAAEKRDKTTVSYHYRNMWVSPLVGVLLLASGLVVDSRVLPLCVLFGLWWLAAPWFACEISRPAYYKDNRLKEENKALFSLLTRQMWAYFEDFSTAEHNYLVPDNVQMEPKQKVAARTSPTNIGLLLAATLCARDFGYISTAQMVQRIGRTLDTIDKLKKWQGHLLNWYNTKTLEAMPPEYVSTVDNGNYIADLIMVRQGLLDYIGKPDVTKKHLEALLCTAELARGERPDLPLDTAPLTAMLRQDALSARDCAAAAGALLQGCKESDSGWHGRLARMAKELQTAFTATDRDNDARLSALAARIEKIVDSTSFLPLYDAERQLFTIGYDIAQEKKNNSYYDLLMSEARQTSFIAVARGEVGREHWFRLGRSMAAADLHTGLLSWTGTMFEYLMPLLLMRSYRNTVFDESYNFALREQMKYAMKFAPVYGISESGYYSFDEDLNYAYQAFGVPVLGLKRGLASERVIAPYASLMSAMLAPNTAAENTKKLIGLGAYGPYGLYEAIDFTKRRLAQGEPYMVVKSFMVHHIGMSLLAMDNVFFKNLLQHRFLKEPFIRAGSYLLGEKIPISPPVSRATKYEDRPKRRDKKTKLPQQAAPCERTVVLTGGNDMPQAHILSNKTYMMYLNSEGYGYAKLGDININRFSAYGRGEKGGFFVFVTDDKTGETFPATLLHNSPAPKSGSVAFYNDKALFTRCDDRLDTKTQITVCPDENAQLHEVTITNHEQQERMLTLTFYTDVILTKKQDDEAHRAFSGLFVSTQYEKDTNILFATRRKRFAAQQEIWACLGVTGDGIRGDISYETDREKFIGRNRTLTNARALESALPLTNSEGAVLDPVLALRVPVRIGALESTSVSFILSAGETRDTVRQICESLKGKQAVGETFVKAQAYASLFLRYLDLKNGEEERLLSYLPAIVEGKASKKRYAERIRENRLSKSGLWKFGISGDLPFLLAEVKNADMLARANWAIKLYHYFNIKGLALDVVLLCGEEHSYQDTLLQEVRARTERFRAGFAGAGRIFVLEGGKVSTEEKNLLFTFCACVLDTEQYRIADRQFDAPLPVYSAAKPKESEPLGREELLYFNGYGGFDTAREEYVIYLKDGESTPMPWSNVLANEQFGAVVTESGGGFCYSRNSALNKLTPWSNDAVGDPSYEQVFVKDTQSGYVFSPTRTAWNQNGDYKVCHGVGYSRYMHNEDAINTQMCVFVPHDAPVKVMRLTLKNTADTPRELALTYTLYPVLGQRLEDARFVTTHYEDGVLYAKNVCNAEFSNLTAFAACSEPITSFTTDAEGFDTKDGSVPAALLRERLGGETTAGAPPVLALQTKLTLDAGEEKCVVFVLGQAHTKEAGAAVKRFTNLAAVEESLQNTRQYWAQMTGGIRVKTPDASMDLMLNGRLLYQTVACRLFARSAFYQCGGAYGYRDQLQDVLALLPHSPQRAKQQILLHAAHQFEEGDVLHWWHSVENGNDRGIRTRFSDDLLWLAYVTLEYIRVTGDASILDEQAAFVTGAPLGDGVDELYYEVGTSQATADIYTHMLLAVRRALQLGAHGLLLMGSGDWNDGMSSVGNGGKGESVWLTWFMCDILERLIPICERRGDSKEAKSLSVTREDLIEAANKNAWDGKWYIRAFFDDGSPLGSHENSECKIDALVQAWSVISRAGAPDKAVQAMEAVKNYLVSKENGLIALLTPAFQNSDPSPGYIQSYVEGVRENGGQYTHAAVWVVMAAAMLGDGNTAWQYFHMINPVNHTQSAMQAARYKNEPYALSADVYTNPAHMGRAGWSFYTGAAGWYYKVGTEQLLGLKKRGSRLYVQPCVPDEWDGFEAEYWYGSSVYRIHVLRDRQMERGKSCEKQSKEAYILLEDGQGTVETTVYFN